MANVAGKKDCLIAETALFAGEGLRDPRWRGERVAQKMECATGEIRGIVCCGVERSEEMCSRKGGRHDGGR